MYCHVCLWLRPTFIFLFVLAVLIKLVGLVLCSNCFGLVASFPPQPHTEFWLFPFSVYIWQTVLSMMWPIHCFLAWAAPWPLRFHARVGGPSGFTRRGFPQSIYYHGISNHSAHVCIVCYQGRCPLLLISPCHLQSFCSAHLRIMLSGIHLSCIFRHVIYNNSVLRIMRHQDTHRVYSFILA